MLSFFEFLYLTEAKVKDVLTKYPHLLAFDLPQKHLSAYGMHLGKITSTADDASKVRDAVAKFDTHKNKLPQERRDISSFQSLDDIHSSINPLIAAAEARKKEKEQMDSDAPIVHEEDGIKVRRVDTEGASCKYGGGTKWCVSGKNNNMFDEYSNEGRNKMYIIHTPEGKFAYHEGEDGVGRNEADEAISIPALVKKYPQLANSPHLRGSKFGVNFLTDPDEINDRLTRDIQQTDDKTLVQNAARHPNLSEDQITNVIKTKNHSAVGEIVKNPSLQPHHIDMILNMPDDTPEHVKINALRHPNATTDHIDWGLSQSNSSFRKAAIENPNANEDHIKKALTDKVMEIKLRALEHPNLPTNIINQAIKSPHWMFATAVAKNPSLTPDHLTQLLQYNDDVGYVSGTATQHPKINADHISQFLSNPNTTSISSVEEHPLFNSDHITQVLNDPKFADSHDSAILHPKATPEHFARVLNNPTYDATAKTAAMGRISWKAPEVQRIANDENESNTMRYLAQEKIKRAQKREKETDDLYKEISSWNQ